MARLPSLRSRSLWSAARPSFLRAKDGIEEVILMRSLSMTPG